jgi:DegV family protein with EDD domain
MGTLIRIVTDSSCDLPAEVLAEFQIEVVPLNVHYGTEVYPDGELSLEAFWEKAEGPEPLRTSQPAVGAFEQVFEGLVAQGKEVLCVTLTGKHSGTFNSAQLAAQRFGPAVRVFDSESLSLGLGLQALRAAQAAWTGSSMAEILALLEDLRGRMRLTIVLDTLENLKRGGRADGFIAVAERMTSALKIKVLINLVEGQLRLVGPARTFEGALRRMLTMVEGMGPVEDLAVVHARRQEMAAGVVEALARRTRFPKEEIWLAETGAVLATHAGRGVIGVLAVPLAVD